MILAQAYDVPQTTSAQWALSVVVVLAMLAVVTVLRYRAAYLALDDDRRRNKEKIIAGLQRQSATGMTLSGADIRDGSIDLEGTIDRLFESAASNESKGRINLSSLYTLRAIVSDVTGNTFEAVPSRAVRAGKVALLLVVLATPVSATAVLQSVITSSSDLSSLSALVGALSDAGAVLTSIAVGIAKLFPLADAAGVLLAGGGLAAPLVYKLWWVWAGMLVIEAAGLVVLSRYADVEVRVLQLGKVWWLGIPGAAALIWIAGTIPAVVGVIVDGAIGTGGIAAGVGQAIGAIVAVICALALFVGAARRWIRWLRIRSRDKPDERPSRAQMGAIVLSRVTTATLFVAVPTAIAYGVVGVVGGDYVSVASAALDASPIVWAALAFGIVGAVAFAIRVSQRFARTIVESVRNASIRAVVKAVLWKRAFPGGIAIAVAIGIMYLSNAIVPSIVIGMAIGILVLLGYRVIRRARYSASVLTAHDDEPLGVYLQVWILEDWSEQRIYVADVNGQRLANPDRSTVIRAAAAVIDETANGEPVRQRYEHEYYRAMRQFGITDWDEIVEKSQERARKALVEPLRDSADGVVDLADVRAAVEDEPIDGVDYWWPKMRQLGMIDVVEDGVLYDRAADPWLDR